MSLKRKNPPTWSPADGKKPKKNADLTSFFGPPKVTPASAGKPGSQGNGAAAIDAAPVKFDKEKWVAGLSDEQKELLRLEIDTLDPSWLAVLKDEVVSPGFLELKRFLQKEIKAKEKIYPPMEDVYSWSVVDSSTTFHFVGLSLRKLTCSQVSPLSAPPGPRRDSRTRPIPRPQSSSWSVFLRPTADASPSVPQEYLHRDQEGVSELQPAAQERRLTHSLGGTGRAPPQHVPHRARRTSQLTRQSRVGEVYAEGDRRGGESADPWRRVSGLGITGAEAVRED